MRSPLHLPSSPKPLSRLLAGALLLGLTFPVCGQEKTGHPFKADPNRNPREGNLQRPVGEDGQRFRPLSKMALDHLQSSGTTEAQIRELQAGIAEGSLQKGDGLYELYESAKDLEDSQADDPRLRQKPIPNLITEAEIAAGVTLADKGTGRSWHPGQHARIAVSLQPERIGPNQTGKIIMVMTMRDHAVMKAPAPLAFHHRKRQGILELGEPVLRAPQRGRYAPAFRGIPVYDEYVFVEIPIQVNGVLSATMMASIEAEFLLNDAESGEPLGVFPYKAQLKVPVGSAMAEVNMGRDELAEASVVEASASAADRPGTAAGANRAVPQDASMSRGDRSGAEAQGPTELSPESGAAMPQGDVGGGDSFLLLGLGGLGLLGILALLLRSRR